MQLSYWEHESFFKNIDVAVIGSGIVGLNAAWAIKKQTPHLNVAVLERSFLPYGASTRNAGFACFGSVSELLDDLNSHSWDEVFALVEKRYKGLLRLRENLGDEAIDFHNWGGYEVFGEADESLFEACLNKLETFNSALLEITGQAEVYKQTDAKISQFGLHGITHLIENIAEGQIDTGKMMTSLLKKVRASGVNIINGFPVDSVQEEGTQALIISGDQHISVKNVLITTNAFAKELLPEAAVIPGRAQVLITKPIPDLKIKGTFHYDKGYYYFRNINDRLLLGGGRNLDFKTEETTVFGLTEKVQRRLELLLKENILPDQPFEIDRRWSGIMGLGHSKRTIMQAVSENVFCAVRLGGMGVAIGSLIGEEAAEMVLQKVLDTSPH